ncbi:MAG TPA: hypothetical protein VKE29_02255 [Candidatus Udaeobacter sp.]|nr:hypothetical protein [Candidatus Udaeobacter sp.]
MPGDDRLLSAFAVELAEILKDRGLYQRGGLPFIVNRRQDGLEAITPQMLRTLVEDHLICYRIKTVGDTELSLERTMSESDAKGVLSSQQFIDKLPTPEKIATARLPVMRQDARIELLPAGYDRESLTLTIPQCNFDENLSLSAAITTIDELLSEFPFKCARRSKAVAVSAIVSLFAVGLLPKAALRPVFIYLANAEGAGKTLLAKCAISPAHGIVKTDGDLKDKTETAKELLAAVIEARPYILFDNCKGYLDSPYLEAFVNAAVWSGRILGVSKMFAGENLVTVFVTGNGCTMSPDMRRRSLFVELFMEDARAEDREFRRILDDRELIAMRPQMLAALWALVREWDVAGRPKATRPHSTFPRWADTIGGIVEFAGYGCPLESPEIENAADIDGTDMRELVKLFGDTQPQNFDEVVSMAREHGLFERLIGTDGELKSAEKSRVGKLLKRYDQRIFDGARRFVVDGKGHTRMFRVVWEHSEHG